MYAKVIADVHELVAIADDKDVGLPLQNLNN
jgi:hypothetical protein